MKITTWTYPDGTAGHITLPRTWGRTSGICPANAERLGFVRPPQRGEDAGERVPVVVIAFEFHRAACVGQRFGVAAEGGQRPGVVVEEHGLEFGEEGRTGRGAEPEFAVQGAFVEKPCSRNVKDS